METATASFTHALYFACVSSETCSVQGNGGSCFSECQPEMKKTNDMQKWQNERQPEMPTRMPVRNAKMNASKKCQNKGSSDCITIYVAITCVLKSVP
jgi:hypothetical protein